MNVFFGIFILFSGLVITCFVSELYRSIRKRFTTPKIGSDILVSLLKRGDYVCLNGKVMQFSHIANPEEPLSILSFPSEGNKTIGGEIAFENNNGIGYIYINSYCILANCDFIYGKYGLKWARNRDIAKIAEEKMRRYD